MLFVAFGGEFTLFGGLEDCLKFVQSYKFQSCDIAYLRKELPNYIEDAFYDYLTDLDMNDVKVYAVPEGSNDPQMKNLYLLNISFRFDRFSACTIDTCRRTYFKGTVA